MKQPTKNGLVRDYGFSANQELKAFVRSLPIESHLKPNEITYNRVLNDKYLIAKAVKHGVTNKLFLEIKNNSPFSEVQWSIFLDINSRTLQRHKRNKNYVYKISQSERIFELAEIVTMGDIVFDTREQFEIWLNTPSIALGREKPIDLLDNSYGKELVIAELNRIEHGIFV